MLLLLRTTTTTLTTITTHSILSPPKLLSLSFRLISTTTSPSLTLPKATTLLSSYGPTLRKGTPPPPPQLNPSQNDETDPPPIFDNSQFTRTYSISALRVPADLCSDLERRIRGHLLNWPRVRNVARVTGDDIDEEVRDLIVGKSGGDDEEGRVRGLERRAEGDGKEDGERFSRVLLRDRLVKDFNARGFMRFKNLARISRPNNRKKKERKEDGRGGSGSESEGEAEGEKRKRRKGSVLVEVVEEGEGSEGELSGLLGEEYKVRKWRGSTRLLLLDERYVGRRVEELPEAIKVRE